MDEILKKSAALKQKRADDAAAKVAAEAAKVAAEAAKATAEAAKVAAEAEKKRLAEEARLEAQKVQAEQKRQANEARAKKEAEAMAARLNKERLEKVEREAKRAREADAWASGRNSRAKALNMLNSVIKGDTSVDPAIYRSVAKSLVSEEDPDWRTNYWSGLSDIIAKFVIPQDTDEGQAVISDLYRLINRVKGNGTDLFTMGRRFIDKLIYFTKEEYFKFLEKKPFDSSPTLDKNRFDLSTALDKHPIITNAPWPYGGWNIMFCVVKGGGDAHDNEAPGEIFAIKGPDQSVYYPKLLGTRWIQSYIYNLSDLHYHYYQVTDPEMVVPWHTRTAVKRALEAVSQIQRDKLAELDREARRIEEEKEEEETRRRWRLEPPRTYSYGQQPRRLPSDAERNANITAYAIAKKELKEAQVELDASRKHLLHIEETSNRYADWAAAPLAVKAAEDKLISKESQFAFAYYGLRGAVAARDYMAEEYHSLSSPAGSEFLKLTIADDYNATHIQADTMFAMRVPELLKATKRMEADQGGIWEFPVIVWIRDIESPKSDFFNLNKYRIDFNDDTENIDKAFLMFLKNLHKMKSILIQSGAKPKTKLGMTSFPQNGLNAAEFNKKRNILVKTLKNRGINNKTLRNAIQESRGNLPAATAPLVAATAPLVAAPAAAPTPVATAPLLAAATKPSALSVRPPLHPVQQQSKTTLKGGGFFAGKKSKSRKSIHTKRTTRKYYS